MKNRITFCTFWGIFGWNRDVVNGKKVPIKIWPTLLRSHNSGACSNQKILVPVLASFVAIKYKGRFFNFSQLFEVWLLFQVPQPITWQKYLPFINAEFNSASIDTSCKKFRQTIEEIAYYFPLAPLRFSANLIKFTFSVFPDYSGCVAESLLVPVDGEKLAGTFKKKSVHTSSGTLPRSLGRGPEKVWT